MKKVLVEEKKYVLDDMQMLAFACNRIGRANRLEDRNGVHERFSHINDGQVITVQFGTSLVGEAQSASKSTFFDADQRVHDGRSIQRLRKDKGNRRAAVGGAV
jgi:hypothetical protein